MKSLPHPGLAFGVALLLLLLGADSALAHALGVECRLRGDKVEVEAYFDDDTPARDARVKVTDGTDRAVAEGKTDDRGLWRFPAPGPGKYQVAVDAGAGHRAKTSVIIPAKPPGAFPPAAANPHLSPGGEEGPTVSEGPPRSEFIRFPLIKVAIGLAGIGFLTLVLFLTTRKTRVSGGRQPPEGQESL